MEDINLLVTGGDVWLKQGGASWLGEKQTHTLSVDNLTAHITRENPGWQFSIPDTRITMDGKPWPSGALTLAWVPEHSESSCACRSAFVGRSPFDDARANAVFWHNKTKTKAINAEKTKCRDRL